MDKDYYQILGVGEKATDDEIKASFRKLSLKYHPDRQANKSDEEKAEAEKKFKEINEAYQTLSDKDKREAYDMERNGGGFDMNDIFSHFDFGRRERSNAYDGFMNNYDVRHTTIIQGKSVQMVIPVTLEELYTGTKKTVRYDVEKRCPNCHGVGGQGETSCDECNGSGFVTMTQRIQGMVMRQQTTCRACKGTGRMIKHKCPSCNGTGMRKSSETLEVTIPKGVQDGYAITYEMRGCESHNKDGMNGDFIAVFKYQIDDKYMVNGFDVIEHIYVDYYELMLGCEYTVTLPNKKTKRIMLPSCVQEGSLIKIIGEGIPCDNQDDYHGMPHDYYVSVHYKMPEELSDCERKNLENIKVEKYKECHQSK